MEKLTSLRPERTSCTMDADERERDRRLYFKNLRNSRNDEGRRGREKRVREKTMP